MQQEREKKRQAVVGICFQFPPSGRCILLFMAGRGGFGFFLRRDGAGFLLSEAGRGGCFFFPRRDGAVVVFFRGGTGWLFFFFSTGRDGAVFFFFFEGRDGMVVFGGGIFFGGTGQNRYTVSPKVV